MLISQIAVYFIVHHGKVERGPNTLIPLSWLYNFLYCYRMTRTKTIIAATPQNNNKLFFIRYYQKAPSTLVPKELVSVCNYYVRDINLSTLATAEEVFELLAPSCKNMQYCEWQFVCNNII